MADTIIKTENEIGIINEDGTVFINEKLVGYISPKKLYRIKRGILVTLNKKGQLIDAHGIPVCQCEGDLNLEKVAIDINSF